MKPNDVLRCIRLNVANCYNNYSVPILNYI